MASVVIKKAGETSPSEQLVSRSASTSVVTDRLGRKIELRKLTPLDRMRMSKAAGADNSTNQPYMLYALVACSTVSIDGEPTISPQTAAHLEGVIALLGDEGYGAALDTVLSFYPSSPDEVIETAKK